GEPSAAGGQLLHDFGLPVRHLSALDALGDRIDAVVAGAEHPVRMAHYLLPHPRRTAVLTDPGYRNDHHPGHPALVTPGIPGGHHRLDRRHSPRRLPERSGRTLLL